MDAGESSPGSLESTARVFGQKSCDQCRNRKVKCIPISGSRPVHGTSPNAPGSWSGCMHCARRHETCTFEYLWRKPGRRKQINTASQASAISRSPHPVSPSSRPFADQPYSSVASIDPIGTGLFHLREPHNGTVCPTDLEHPLASLHPPSGLVRPSPGSFLGSARHAITSPSSFRFDFSFPRNESRSSGADKHGDVTTDLLSSWEPSAEPSTTTHLAEQLDDRGPSYQPPMAGLSPSKTPLRLLQSPAAAWISPSVLYGSNSIDPSVPTAYAAIAFPEISHFASWEDVCFFVSLHLRRQHVLVPLVHQPTFAADMLHRRDKDDEAFRGLLLSIVSYTICQTPAHLLETSLDRSSLEALLRSCQRGSRLIQIRHQMKPSITTLQSTVLDWITSQATTAVELPENLMSDVRRLVFSLKIHTATPTNQHNRIGLEVCRRLYWEAVAIDQTAAMYGHPIAIPYFEGTPPLPTDVDDEYILEDDILFQPKSKTSYMTGFNFVTRVFKLFQSATWRKHLLDNTGTSPELEVSALKSYLRAARDELSSITGELPSVLRPVPLPHGADGAVFGTQAANICITTFCLDLYLASLAAKLDLEINFTPSREITKQKEETAGRAFKEIQMIPIEYLASNGESLRGKVLWIITTLLKASSDPDQLSAGVWDWWNMYSQIQFVQIIPTQLASAVPTRPPSPRRTSPGWPVG